MANLFNNQGSPIDLDPRDWVEVMRILQEEVPGLEVCAFGSRTKGTAKPYSDLDLAVITTRALTLEQMAAVSDAFANSDLPIRVDVVGWSSCSDAFRQIISKNKVVVQPGSAVR